MMRLRIEPTFEPTLLASVMDALISELLKLQNSTGHLVIYPHVRADGDALGAAGAISLLAEKLEIPVIVLLEEKVPKKLSFIPGLQFAKTVSTVDSEKLLSEQAVALAVDSHGADRLGLRETLYDNAPVRMVIDHHVSERPLHDLYYKDVKAAATCEIITGFVLRMEERLATALLDDDIATALMTGLMTDTGRFSFSNVTSQTFASAACLKAHEVSMDELSETLFDKMTAARMYLISVVSSNITYYYNGRLAVSQIRQEDMDAVEAQDTDTDGLVNMMRDVEGVEVALLLTETAEGDVRGNLRSKQTFDSAKFARSLGGGGHVPAAGFTMENTSLKEAWAYCVKAMKEQLGIRNAKLPFTVSDLE